MVFEKMLVGNTTLDKPDTLLLGELSNQNVEVGNFLVRSGKTMVYDEMNSFRVPDLLDTHLTENLDRQRSSTILRHRHVRRQNCNLARMMDPPASISFDADDLLGKRERVIIQNRLRQAGREAEPKLSLLKMNPSELLSGSDSGLVNKASLCWQPTNGRSGRISLSVSFLEGQV